MKSVIKFLPVALGVLTLASCSNNDFLGGETIDAINGPELIATVEEPAAEIDGTGTRAAFETTSGKYAMTWQVADKFRVYDEALQKYDEYSAKKDGEAMKITLDGKAAVATPSKAIFPGDAVNYAGWDKAGDVVTATMKVPAAIDYAKELGQTTTTVGGKEAFAYVSHMPLWGDATKDGDNLKVSLKFLTAYTDITLYKSAGVNAVRLVAGAAAATKTQLEAATPAAADLDATTPLAGYFDAQLKEGGQLVLTSGDLKDLNKSSILTVTNIPVEDSVHVILPVIPATYKYLSIQTSTNNGTSWTEQKTYKNTAVKRNVVIRKGLQFGNAPITAHATSLKELNTRLATLATAYAGKTVDVILDGEIATEEGETELKIPTGLTANQTVNIKGEIKNAFSNIPLTISGGKSGFTYTLNIEDGINGTENINVTAAGTLVLVGSATSTHKTHNKINTTSADLVLGKGEFGAFNTNMTVVTDKAITVNAGAGTVNAVNNNGTKATVVESGTLTTLTKTQATGDVTVNGGIVTTLTANTAAVAYTFATDVKADGEITTINSNSTGAVAISGAATTITTSGDVTVNAGVEVATVTLGAKNKTVTVNGGTGTDAKLAMISTLNIGEYATTLASSGKAAVKTISGTGAVTATSTWNKDAASTTEIENGNIYTAAQLAGIKTGTNYTLKADITIADDAVWTPVNLNGNFTAIGRFVKGLKAPLFNKISGGVIGGDDTATSILNTNLFRLTNVNIALNSGNLGALAKEIDGTVTLQRIYANGTVASTNEANSANIGGIVGTAKGNVTMSNVFIGSGSGTAANIKGYKNVGGYIGSVGAGTLKIQISKNWTTKSNIALIYIGKDAKPAAADAGTFGNFIGSIVGKADITIEGIAEGSGSVLTDFIKGSAISTASGATNTNTAFFYNENKNAAEKAFIGMQGTILTNPLTYEIGRSTDFKSLLLYNKMTDDIGNPYTISIANINQYAE